MVRGRNEEDIFCLLVGYTNKVKYGRVEVIQWAGFDYGVWIEAASYDWGRI